MVDGCIKANRHAVYKFGLFDVNNAKFGIKLFMVGLHAPARASVLLLLIAILAADSISVLVRLMSGDLQ